MDYNIPHGRCDRRWDTMNIHSLVQDLVLRRWSINVCVWNPQRGPASCCSAGLHHRGEAVGGDDLRGWLHLPTSSSCGAESPTTAPHLLSLGTRHAACPPASARLAWLWKKVLNNSTKTQPYILRDRVLDSIHFVVAWGYSVPSGGAEWHCIGREHRKS